MLKLTFEIHKYFEIYPFFQLIPEIDYYYHLKLVEIVINIIKSSKSFQVKRIKYQLILFFMIISK